MEELVLNFPPIVYSFPNKQKGSDSSAGMTLSMGSNLSELDRLLLELNAVQQSTPAFATEGSHTHYFGINKMLTYIYLMKLRWHCLIWMSVQNQKISLPFTVFCCLEVSMMINYVDIIFIFLQ